MTNPFRAFWAYLQTVRAPVNTSAGPSLAPAVPAALSQEEFPATPAQVVSARRQDLQLHSLYKRLVKTNNANVQRDFGQGLVDVHVDRSIQPLTAQELSHLAGSRAGIKVMNDTDR